MNAEATTPQGGGKPSREDYDACMLAMARAVESVGMYGTSHPSSQGAITSWLDRLAPLVRSRGAFSIGTDGHVTLVDGRAFSTTNPVILSLLRRLYTTRAGKLELLSGFGGSHATAMARFLADADENTLATSEHSFEAWAAREDVRHVRVSEIEFRELKTGDRVVSGRRPRTSPLKEAQKAPPEPLKPDQVVGWVQEFREEADRAGRPAPIAPKVKHSIADYLRHGTGSEDVAQLGECMALAAKNMDDMSELILKIALVQQEVAQRADDGVGEDVVSCLRTTFGAIQQTPDAQTEEGWANLVRMLAELERRILEKLQSVTGGNKADADAIRAGVQEMHRELEGEALKREREQKRKALQQVERRIKRFFGDRNEDAKTDTPPSA